MKHAIGLMVPVLIIAASVASAGCASDADQAELDNSHAELKSGQNGGIMWGINIHPPGQSSAYRIKSPTDQVGTVKAIGGRHVRVNYGAFDDVSVANLNELLAAGKAHGVLVTPVLTPAGLDTEHNTYWNAHDVAFKFARRFRGAVPVWELGNETNSYMFKNDAAFEDNSDPVKFQVHPNYGRILAMMRGLTDGVREADETARVAIGDSGGCNYGYTQALWNDGVRWDITIAHLYDFWGDPANRGTSGAHCSRGDDMLAQHTQYHKPIWITEFNWTPAAHTGNKADMGNGIAKMMDRFQELNRLKREYDVELADLYELYDEPDAGDKDGPERHFGLLSSTAEKTLASDDAHRYFINHPSANYDLTPATKAAYFGNFALRPGQSTAKNGLQIQMQDDGNFVVADILAGRALWSTGTGKGAGTCAGCSAVFQADGNLVLYGNDGKSFWSTNTGNSGVDGMFLRSHSAKVQLRAGGTVRWSSN